MVRQFLLALLFLPTLLTAQLISLSGHLGAKEVSAALLKVQEAEKVLYISIDSTSGDLAKVVDLSRQIYEKRVSQDLEVIVYIDGNAIGPAAIVPFLATKRYASLFASWGDIPQGNEETFSTNLLRKQVEGLLAKDSAELRAVAAAMTDSNFESALIDVRKGETLVLNQREMVNLKLVDELLTPAAFRERFALAEEKELKEAEQSPLAVTKGLFEDQLQQAITVNPDKNLIGHIVIDDRTSGISQATWIYVKKALDHYKEVKPAFIILELNTPGGEVFSSQKISDALKEMDTQYGIPVVGFINNWAISAGAMLAYSTRFITVVKDASMGAAEPVIQGEGGQMQSASEKVNSALRADFANRARFFDRNPDLAEAMVDKDIILVFRNGEILKLSSEDEIRRKGTNPDVVITAKGKLLTLNAEQLVEYGVADRLLLPKKRVPITEAEKDAGRWPADKMLLFQYPFFDSIPNATVDSYRMDWRTQFFALLSTPMISSVLFLGMMLGFYMEFNSPGFGVPGAVGLTCLSLIILSSFALEIGSMLELALLIFGVLMLAGEIFLLPGFGLLGFVGIIFFLTGLFGLMLPALGSVDYEFETGTFNAAGDVVLMRMAWLGGTLILGLVLMVLLGRYVMPKFAGFSRLVLEGHEQDAKEGFYAGSRPDQLPSLGDRGVVTAPLRTSGKVSVDGTIYDATSEGGFIERGASVIVTRIDGHLIFVAELEEA